VAASAEAGDAPAGDSPEPVETDAAAGSAVPARVGCCGEPWALTPDQHELNISPSPGGTTITVRREVRRPVTSGPAIG
jgi:hypothetical protein